MRFSRQLGTAQPLYNFPPAWNRIQTALIPDGDAGIAATIAHMKALVNGPQGIRSMTVRKYALDAARGSERGMSEVESIFDQIQRDIEFRGEYGETLQTPEATINLGAGDCDDHSMLAAAILQSLGYETQFRAISLKNNAPDELSHVYTLVRDKRNGRWFPLDPTVEASYPGWEPNEAARVEDYGPNSGANTDLVAGLGVLLLGFLLSLLCGAYLRPLHTDQLVSQRSDC